MRKYFSHNVKTVLYVYKFLYKKQDCHLVFVEPLVRIHEYAEAKMSEQKSKKPSSTGRSEERIRRNHEILGMIIKAGVSAGEVAQTFKLNYSGAKKICSKLKLTGDCGRTPGSGRKRKTTERSDRFTAKSSKSGTPIKKEITNELKNQTGVEVSTKTIQRRLKEKGITWQKKSKKPYVGKKNRFARLKFAREHAGWSIEQWKRVVWSDESPFDCKNQSQQHVWRTKQETGARNREASEVNQCMGVFFVAWCWRSASGKEYFDWDRILENFDLSYGSISQSIKP